MAPEIDDTPPGAARGLSTTAQYLRGVGPMRAELLARLGIHTAAGVLFHFPRDYRDLTDVRPIAELEHDKELSVIGTVEEVEQRPTQRGGTVLGVLLRDGNVALRGMWFNQPFMAEKFRVGQRVMFAGRVRQRGLMWEMSHPLSELIDGDLDPAGENDPPAAPAGRVLPIYPLCEGLNQGRMRRITAEAVKSYGPLLEEVLPEEYRQQHELLGIQDALAAVHMPGSMAQMEQGRRRFIYQELLVMQLALALQRNRQVSQADAPPLPLTARIDARIRRLIPFALTAGQQQAIAEITADMARAVPMNRLLQGEVGSGKTIVALYAVLLAVAHRAQAVLMAPTEILARQHHRSLAKLLTSSSVRFELLTGGTTSSERAALLGRITRGEVDVVVGTHAVLEPDVKFARLGLAVIDEQQKFGVRERARLKGAGLSPHYLVMTATPIPRTMALTLFGDLDVSTLLDAPPGRQPVHTYLAGEDRRARWWEFFRKKLHEGRQGYVVAPLVGPAEREYRDGPMDGSQRAELASVEAMYESLTNGELADFRVGLVHGRMSPEEKDTVVEEFRAGRTQVLLGTTVIEVGVDVPNATLMTIESGERFGLSQLHQLRGRISRGSYPGYCCVFADASHEDAQARLEAFVSTTDGFRLAEVDFQLRGPGDLFGAKQSGMPRMRIANLLRDGRILEEARRDARELIEIDPGLAQPEYALLRKQVLTRYGRALDLGDVG